MTYTGYRAMMLAILVTAALAGAGGTAAAASCKAQVMASSTFTSSTQGWTSNTPAEIARKNSGGNPAGFIQFTDNSSSSTFIDAPAAYRGSYAALQDVGYITWQHAILSETGATSYSPYEVRLYGGSGSEVKFDGTTPGATTTGWQTVVAPLTQADWTVVSGSWSDAISNVTDLQIDIELVTNQTIPGDTDIEGIDNVALVALPCGFFAPKS